MIAKKDAVQSGPCCMALLEAVVAEEFHAVLTPDESRLGFFSAPESARERLKAHGSRTFCKQMSQE